MFIWFEHEYGLKVRWLYVWLLEWIVYDGWMKFSLRRAEKIYTQGSGFRILIISSIVMMITLSRA